MNDAPPHPRSGVTVRLDAATQDRLQRIAASEHWTLAGYVRLPIARDLHARDETPRVVHVFTAAGLEGAPPGEPEREPGETDDRYARRADTLRVLLGGE
ncbi:MAG TPA: hypothetical protein VMB34_17065 [Acetobacteraceae bacterium]|nr:hypothetical protein [Acetobacteraceae bacterium]